jgi:hypothetical protein
MAAITVNRPLEEVERRWRETGAEAPAQFRRAPGDRGTEIHAEGDAAKLKDLLRNFKARVETGEVPRSDATPEGESIERKLDQRPAQPLSDEELAKVGAR